MPSIDWNTVATAGATAVFVTLAVEYVAKPGMEARKERVLEDARLRRDLVTAIMDLALSAAILITDVLADASAPVKQSLREERRRHYDRMRRRIDALHDDAGRYARAYQGAKRVAAFQYLNCVKGVVLSERTRYQQAGVMHSLAAPVATILEGTLAHPIRFQNARLKLAELVADTEVPVEPEPAGADRASKTSPPLTPSG
ncbi:hypothetical protein EEZ25_24430 [Micromonospora aurantiaca]|uniref:hypothetical protein n=1 Tax=Micromonospora aurantiaca (nom. illeg.) TaxID=47850 RepID=UPI000F3CAC05|nr:hypothetical protein [Micromonospora aurantiaca]RNH98850.1 hypothetical protein EEZ25_24430 [Micromonospora aurantiaca]